MEGDDASGAPTIVADAAMSAWAEEHAGRALSVPREALRELHAHGQMERKFIVASASRVLYVIDQHAADERVQLERLLKETVDARTGMPTAMGGGGGGGVTRKRLRPPLMLQATPHECSILARHAERIGAPFDAPPLPLLEAPRT